MSAVQNLPVSSVLGKRVRAAASSASTTPVKPAPKRVRKTPSTATSSASFVLFDNNDENENPFITPRKVTDSSPFLESVQRSVIRHDVASNHTLEDFESLEQPSLPPSEDTLHFSTTSSALSSPTKRTRRIAKPANLQKASLKIDLQFDFSSTDTPPVSAISQTPRRSSRTATVKQRVPSTPRHRVLIPGKPLTPRSPATHAFSTAGSAPPTPRSALPQHPPIEVYRQARQLFVRSVQNVELVGRDEERRNVVQFIAPRLRTRTSGCLYVSGPPGTGKTAFLTHLCRGLTQSYGASFSVVNCMGIRSAKDLAARFLEIFHPDGVDAFEGQEMDILKRKFHLRKQANLIILDEIDHLLDVDLDFMYTVFDWALEHEQIPGHGVKKPTSNLVLVGISNALDLTDRFLPKLKARSLKPTLLPFPPYSSDQIARIITSKLRSLLPAEEQSSGATPFIQPTAITFLAKKVAAQTGDLRRAFDLARAAIDAVETDTRNKLAVASPGVSRTLSPLKKRAPLGETAEPNARQQDSSATLEPAVESCVPIYTVCTAPKAALSHVARITAAAFTNNGPAARIRSLNLQQKAVLCALASATAKQQKQRQSALPIIGEDEENQDPEAAFYDLLGTPSRHSYFRAAFSRAKTPSAPSTPSKKGGSQSDSTTVSSLYSTYSHLCKTASQLAPLSSTEFGDVLSSLEAASLISIGDGGIVGASGPTTPSRRGRSAASAFEGLGAGAASSAGRDDWKAVSLIANIKDVRDVCSEGPGASILQRILE